jgi:ribosome-associated protein
MDIRKLQRVIVDGLEDVKAQNIVVFNTEHLSALFERVIIASGTSNRQTKSLASSVREAVKDAGYPVPRTEGERNGEWIIVDCGAAVVHVMQPTIREYYHLEEIWGDKPINMKLASSVTRLVKAAEPEAPVRKAPAKKVATKTAAKSPAKTPTRAATRAPTKTPAKAAPPKAPARKTVAAKTTAAKTTAAKKAPAKKIALPPGKVVTRVVGVKSTAAKKSVAKKTVTRAAPTQKAPAPTLPARKAPARKAPARKTTGRA